MAKPGFGGKRSRVPPVADDKGRQLPDDVRTEAPRARSRRASQARGARDGREQQARALQELHPKSDQPWTPPTSLTAPPPRHGYRQKWVRVAIFGRPDVQNMARKFREGWLPRKANTVPKSFHVPSIRSGQFAGCIGVEGSLLCEMPEARVNQRNAHYRKRAEQMAQDIERNVQNVNRNIPHHAGFGRITKTATSKVVRPATVDIEEEADA